MKKTLPIGHEFYKRIIEKELYYVDKTLLIKDILDKNTQVNLFIHQDDMVKRLL